MLIELVEICNVCGGDGKNPNRLLKNEDIKCYACNGSGKITSLVEVISCKVVNKKKKIENKELFKYKIV